MSEAENLEAKLIKSDFIEALESIQRDDLEGKTQTLGIGGIREFMAEATDNSFRSLIQKFRNKHRNEIYEVALTEHGLKCNCNEWNSRRCCRHIVYVFDKLSIRDEHGRIVGISCKVTETPTYEDAKVMNFGRNDAETDKWQSEHIAVIEL